MAYEVDIQFLPTGEVRTTRHEGEWDDFYWSDGNMACDCTRSDAFRAAGGDARDPGQDCGGERYRVVAVRDAGGVPIDYVERPE